MPLKIPQEQFLIPPKQQAEFGAFESARQKGGLRGVVDKARNDNMGIDLLAGAIPGAGETMMASDIANELDQGNNGTALGLGALGILPFGGTVKKVGGKAYDLMAALRAERNIPDDPSLFTAANKSAQTKLEKQWKSTPSLRNREALRGGETVIDDAHELDPRPIINPEDLVGKVGVQVQGDRTAAGKILREVNGIPLSEPVHLQGGPDYARVHAAHDTGAAWASMQGAATNKQNQFKRVADATGEAPIGIYSAMSVNDGANFSHHVGQALVNQLRALDLPKKVIKQIDQEVRMGGSGRKQLANAAPDFRGLEHPELMDQLLGQNGYDMAGAGEMRKALVNILRKPGIQDLGAPHFNDVIKAVTDPNLYDLPNYASGYTMFRSRPDAELMKNVGGPNSHMSYDTMIPGTYLGGLQQSIPAEIMFPKTYAKHRSVGRNDQQTARSMFLNGEDYEKFDQQWLDGVMNYLRNPSRQ